MDSPVMDKMTAKKVNEMETYAELENFVRRLGRLPINCAPTLVEDIVKIVADAYREGWKDGTDFVLDATEEINRKNKS